jgi:hypothetical protein
VDECKPLHLGLHATEEDALQAYNNYVKAGTYIPSIYPLYVLYISLIYLRVPPIYLLYPPRI